MAKYPIVEVVWLDFETHGETGWNELKHQLNYAKKPPLKMKTVGYLVHECETHISLLSTIGDEESSALDKIPRGMIEEITTYSEE